MQLQRIFRTFTITLVTLLAFASGTASANLEKFGDIHVHYVAFSSTFLTPAIAKAYGITRSRYNGLVNISILDASQPSSPAIALPISGEARNLLGNRVALKFKEIREDNAIYYIAPIEYSNEETFRFKIDLTLPDGSSKSVQFQQKFYAD